MLELNYQKENAEDIVNKITSQREVYRFCAKCGKVTRHKGNRCMRCE